MAELPRMPRHLGRSCVGVSVSGFLQSLGCSLTEGLHLALRPRPVAGEVLGETKGPSRGSPQVLAHACDQFCTYPLPTPFSQTEAVPRRCLSAMCQPGRQTVQPGGMCHAPGLGSRGPLPKWQTRLSLESELHVVTAVVSCRSPGGPTWGVGAGILHRSSAAHRAERCTSRRLHDFLCLPAPRGASLRRPSVLTLSGAFRVQGPCSGTAPSSSAGRGQSWSVAPGSCWGSEVGAVCFSSVGFVD